MKFGDIVALAKQGYTPQDIKDLMKLSEDQPEGGEDEQKDREEEHQTPGQDKSEPEDEKDDEDDNKDDPDYKSLYEAELDKNAKLQKMVLSKDMSGKDNENTDADIFADVMRSFM